jgi:3D (Asp-Asp-Asp) domain-containing protein
MTAGSRSARHPITRSTPLQFRHIHHLLVLATLVGAVEVTPVRAQVECQPYRITAYAASEYPGWTADGSTTTWGAINRGEQIVAASYNLPFGTWVEVEGLGGGRVADRGYLGARHIDWLVPTRGEALEIGSSVRTVCVVPPGETT